MTRQAKLLTQSIEWYSAFFTWVLVSLSSLYFMQQSESFALSDLLIVAGLYISFFVSWTFTIRDQRYSKEPHYRIALFILQVVIIIAIYFSVPYTYNAIFMVMAGTVLPYFMSIARAIAASLLLTIPFWLIFAWHWQREGMLITALLFWTFNLFAIVIVNAMLKAEQVQQALEQKNRELLSTQALLTEATKQSERVRIARNIHDLLGHHLTAMTIKLQVASRLSDAATKQHIDECYQLSKLLLSDVREAVSEIREKSSLDIVAAIQAIQQAVPQLTLKYEIAKDVNIDDVNKAEAILRCVQESITNTLKHSNATECTISLQNLAEQWQLTICDNGSQDQPDFKPGNGLKGIQERMEAVGGSVHFNVTDSGFITTATMER
ncbi:sensor histidine kinase [Alteromonas flava]|uniref:sensor histidine kinase n=1 Tax=Alteromonas flava TaxID=2048003 RepID=UPI000C286EA1|nr:sensor histidine kinase [Alteromonas flava]